MALHFYSSGINGGKANRHAGIRDAGIDGPVGAPWAAQLENMKQWSNHRWRSGIPDLSANFRLVSATVRPKIKRIFRSTGRSGQSATVL